MNKDNKDNKDNKETKDHRIVKKYFNIIALMVLSAGAVLNAGCASTDPLEPYNRAMYQVNRTVDSYTLKPIATAYQAVTPDPVERSVNHFFGNIAEVRTFANSLLQGKFHNATVSSARIVWNTTMGLGGLFDVATAMDLKSEPEDLGQTLRRWGVPEGPYLVLPFFGPSTVTDAVGLAGDIYASPLTHYHWDAHSVRESVTGLQYVNQRAQVLNLSDLVESASTDEYSFVKNAYLQRRIALTNDSQGGEALDEAFDELFEDE